MNTPAGSDTPRTPLVLAELARRLDAPIHCGNTLTMPAALVALTLTQRNRHVTLEHITANPKGTGAGERIVTELAQLCRERGLELTIAGVLNRAFFDRFDWLAPDPAYTRAQLADSDLHPDYRADLTRL